MATEGKLATAQQSAFKLARERRYCELVDAIDKMTSPTPELSALRVFALLRTVDTELAMVKLAQLLASLTGEQSHIGALRRWGDAAQGRHKRLGVVVSAVDVFYQDWQVNQFWKALTQHVRGRELDFIAASVSDRENSYRLLIAVADALKLRGEQAAAFQIYLSMCRVRSNPELLRNVFSLALSVNPDMVYPLTQEFHAG